MEGEIVRGFDIEPIAIKTNLGFILMGQGSSVARTSPSATADLSTYDLRSRPSMSMESSILTPEEAACESHYNSRRNRKICGDSSFVEEKLPHRFLRLEEKLHHYKALEDEYKDKIASYQK